MKRFIKEFLLENWSLKATAILLSLILWLFVKGEPGPESVVRVPIQVLLPRQMESTNERPSMIEVTMRGAAFSSMWFGQPLPNCIINLQDKKEGEHLIPLSTDNIQVPKGSGIEVLQVNPAKVSITLQRTISKSIPITVPIQGAPAHGFEIYGKQIKPSSIIVTGPRSYIEPLRQVFTEPVSINGQKQSVRLFVDLNLKDSAIRTSPNNPVQIDIQIGPHRKIYTISQIPVVVNNPDLATTPSQLSIKVEAPENLIPQLSPADFSVTIDTKNLNVNDTPVRVKPDIRLAKNWNGSVEIKEAIPSEVIVRPAARK
jgi:YbbR domain-containing protein